MTNPVILLGTQSNGETLPVQVDATGRLVAEGLQGTEGPPGPPGENGQDGAPGGSFPLPPDPFEGALLGWLNGGLAWVSGGVTPIPPGLFGPITDWNPDGLLTVDGEIPSSVQNGVYIYQCNEDGSLYTEGWNVSQNWLEVGYVTSDSGIGEGHENRVFDGDLSVGASTNAANSWIKVGLPSLSGTLGVSAVVSMTYEYVKITSNGQVITNNNVQVSAGQLKQIGTYSNVTAIEVKNSNTGSSTNLSGISMSGQTLVTPDYSLGLRVNQVAGNSLIGNPTNSKPFTVGKYLKVPEQLVANWVYREVDPTTDIDLLRSI